LKYGMIKDEVITLKALSDKTCDKYLSCYKNAFITKFDGKDSIVIVSDYVKGTTLSEFIKSNNGSIPPTILWSFYLQLTLGLKFIHDMGFAHRDIKPDNVMIGEDLTVKYIDFGLACVRTCLTKGCMNTCVGRSGTLFYMPPELFHNAAPPQGLTAAKAHDVWSLSIVLKELTDGKNTYPFIVLDANNQLLPDKQISDSIRTAPHFISSYDMDDKRTVKFLNSIIINDWKFRPTIDQIYSMIISDLLAPIFLI